MNQLIDVSISHARAVIMVLLLVLVAGSSAYNNVPKEMNPDVQIPYIYVSMHHEGISPEDAERLLIRPVEKELRTIEGVKEMTANATLGHASVMLEFRAGFDKDRALQNVRDKVDIAKPKLPVDTDEPSVNEVNFSLFPVVNVILTGQIPDNAFINLAKKLRDKIEEIPSVLSVDIAGNREESVEIIINPLTLESYNLTTDIIATVLGNNRLVAAGNMNMKNGAFAIKVPGLLEDLEDILTLPVKANGDAVITIGDIATVRKTFKDVEGYARVNGKSALVLQVSKRTGENIIGTIDKVRATVEETKPYWPDGISVYYAQDQSHTIRDMLGELQNGVLLAIILVMVVIIYFMGVKPSLLVALSIPGSFLFGILVIAAMGLTLNIVVLFSLILSIGMLVDDAIVVVEYANRRMAEGVPYTKAYGEGAKRMVWPITSSTLTKIIVFVPLLFWPGIIGQFMKYLPLTLIATLSGSLLMAIIFIPALGSIAGKMEHHDDEATHNLHISETGNLAELRGFMGGYARLLERVLKRPVLFTIGTFASLIIVIILFGKFGAGTEFFPAVEPDNAQVQVRARGNLSAEEKDRIVRTVEARILDMNKEIKVFYARSGKIAGDFGAKLPEDTVGLITLEFANWRDRRKAKDILTEIRERTKDIPGIVIETQEQQGGPTALKPIQIELSSINPDLLEPEMLRLKDALAKFGGVIDITDNRPTPAIEWQMDINREQAARYGIDVTTLGSFVRLLSNGLVVTNYRPDESDDEVDILLRFPADDRTLKQLETLRVMTPNGAVPISNFVTLKPKQKVGQIDRTGGRRSVLIEANVAAGILPNAKIAEIIEWLKANRPDPQIVIKFKGDQEQQQETGAFLGSAFSLSLFGMLLMLVWQFNSIYYGIVIMSAVFLSTGGVMLGLLVTGQPFGIVMCGLGIIALGGIVVSNNIIFIDTYQLLRRQGMGAYEATLRTGTQRLRPILLTAATAVLGLLPMVFQMNLDFATREVTFGAPSTQWWTQLSTAIAGGLTFATILTLFFTPCLLLLGDRVSARFRKNTVAWSANTTVL